MKLIWTSLLLLYAPLVAVYSQETSNVFSEEQFLWYVKNHHPIALQAELLTAQGESKVRKARGNFDPVLQGGVKQKYYDDKTYYSLIGAGLKIPTWYGVELKTGYDQNRGSYLNPQNELPDGGLWYAGISIPVGKGLVIDKRRAVLKQAGLYAQSTVAERERMLNNLFFEAIKFYWKWVEAWNKLQIYEESVQLAMERFEGVKSAHRLGDLPAIDTLEALIQVQNREMMRNDLNLYYQNITLELSNYLWLENNTPLIITDEIHPPELRMLLEADVIPVDSVENLLTTLNENHPEMRLYDFKLATMDVEKRLMREELKPTVNLEYNTLFGASTPDSYGSTFPNDYVWGVELSFPLFLRKQRGDLQLTKIKMQNVSYGRQQKLLELQNKLRNYYNEHLNLAGQVDLYTDAVKNYEKLLYGEQRKFSTGESSLFLINSRETKLIEAQLKLTGFISRYYIAGSGINWAAGNLDI